MISWVINDARAALGLPKDEIDQLTVLLRPVNSVRELLHVYDVTHKIEGLAFGTLEEVE